MRDRGTDNQGIRQEFRRRQTRQIVAITAALFLVLFVAVIYKRPDIFGEFSRDALFSAQALVIASFIGFTVMNWKCPACNKHLSSDISRSACKKCGSRLQ